MDEWRTDQIKSRLISTANCRNVSETEVFSLKLRPLKMVDAKLDQAYFGSCEYSRLDRSRNSESFFEQHETGPEWLLFAANYASVVAAVAGIIGTWVGLVTYLKSRSKNEPHGSYCDNLRVEVRRFDQSGTLREEIVVTIPLSEGLPADLANRIAETVQSID